jgi:hypothetical protein
MEGRRIASDAGRVLPRRAENGDNRRVREPVDAAKLLRFLEALGARARGPGTVFLVGGATAVLEGWRASTIDVDVKLDPEPAGAFEAIARLKDELSINVELASPDLFLPPLPGWRERSRPVGRFGRIDVRHYDPYSQALAKIERGHDRDRADVASMLDRGLVEPERLRELCRAIVPELIRYPAVDPDALAAKLDAALARTGGGGSR